MRSVSSVVSAAIIGSLALALPPLALADDTEDQFTEDIAHWNSLGGQIPGAAKNWLKAADTVCGGIAELEAGGVSAVNALHAQVQAATTGGWLKRDASYFVMHAVNSFCPEFRPTG